jgi:uncharacterized membrane protein (DUF485 family)
MPFSAARWDRGRGFLPEVPRAIRGTIDQAGSRCAETVEETAASVCGAPHVLAARAIAPYVATHRADANLLSRCRAAPMGTTNARLGLILFCIYLVLYSGFVLLNAFSPNTMERTPVAGINLAILYGFGLIVSALVLALVYGWLCKASENDPDGGEKQE